MTDWSKFDQENFVSDYFSTDSEDLVKNDELNVDYSVQMYIGKVNILLEAYGPLKRIDKYKMSFKSKSWITLGIQK